MDNSKPSAKMSNKEILREALWVLRVIAACILLVLAIFIPCMLSPMVANIVVNCLVGLMVLLTAGFLYLVAKSLEAAGI